MAAVVLPSGFQEELTAARSRAAPVRTMRLRHWKRARRWPGRGTYSLLFDGLNPETPSSWTDGEQWIALYPESASTGATPDVVVPAFLDAPAAALDQGVKVTVWGWPTPGRAVHVAAGDIEIPAAGPCDSWTFKPMPKL